MNPDTGQLVWHFQHFPNDQWDLDWAFERQILDVPVNGITRRVVLTAGKIGIYDAVDARTGEWVFSIDLGLNNIVTEIDARTGEKHVDRSKYPNGTVQLVCPHGAGAKNFIPGAYIASRGRSLANGRSCRRHWDAAGCPSSRPTIALRCRRPARGRDPCTLR